MPAIPDFTALPQAVPQPAGGTAAFEPPNWRQVGMAGESVASAGRTLESASDIVAQANARQDDLVAQAGGNTLAQTKTRLQWDPKIGFANVLEGNAVGPKFIDDYLQRFDTAAASIRDNLQSPAQQKIFDQHAQLQRAAYQQSLFEHQSQQTEKFNDSTDDTTVQNVLSDVAQRPMDDFGFQRGLVTINGVIDKAADRKGLPAPQVDQLKQHYLDAALSSRILSIAQGIPGVMPANPYMAEKYFDQMQGSMGPAARLQLAAEVQKAIVPLQQRDLANALLSGHPPLSSDAMWPAVQGTVPFSVVASLETGGLKNPDAAVSPAGAQGRMQVMPATAADPGFGVRPAQLGPDGKPLPGELDRVGRDFLGAMTARYDQPALVLAAYNAGPGAVDDWMHGTNASGKNPNRMLLGDPRAGQISTADWIDKIPFQETKSYVERGLTKIPASPSDAAPSAPMTASQLKAQLPALADQARAMWLQNYPNDVVGADGAATRVLSYGSLITGAQTARQDAARDTLLSGLVGPSPDGSQKPRTMDALLADPSMKAAWSQASPEVQLQIQDKMKAGGDPPRTTATQTLMYQMTGEFANNRDAFANRDLTPLVSQLPFEDFNHLRDLQVAARNKQEAATDKAINLNHALTLSQDYVLKGMHIVIPDKNTSPDSTQAKTYNAFTGALQQELDQFQKTNNRPPKDSEIVDMARGLVTQVQVPGHVWGTNSKFIFDPEATQAVNTGTAQAAVPDAFRKGITTAFQAKGVAKPSEAQILTAYLQSLRTAPRIATAGSP